MRSGLILLASWLLLSVLAAILLSRSGALLSEPVTLAWVAGTGALLFVVSAATSLILTLVLRNVVARVHARSFLFVFSRVQLFISCICAVSVLASVLMR